MERPVDLLAAGAQVVKQEPQVNVVAVEIVQPDHIRVVFPQLPQKPAGGSLRAEARVVQHPGLEGMEPHLQLRTNAHRGHIRAAACVPAVGQKALVSLGHQGTALLCRDAPGAADARHRVDEKIFHGFLPVLFHIFLRVSVSPAAR